MIPFNFNSVDIGKRSSLRIVSGQTNNELIRGFGGNNIELQQTSLRGLHIFLGNLSDMLKVTSAISALQDQKPLILLLILGDIDVQVKNSRGLQGFFFSNFNSFPNYVFPNLDNFVSELDAVQFFLGIFHLGF